MSTRDFLSKDAFDPLANEIDQRANDAEGFRDEAEGFASNASDSATNASESETNAVNAANSINAGLYLVDEGDDFFELATILNFEFIEETITVEGFEFQTLLIQEL